MLLRPGANARRTGTGGHRVFAVTPGTQVVKTSGRDVLTWFHDREAVAAGVDHHAADWSVALALHAANLGILRRCPPDHADSNRIGPDHGYSRRSHPGRNGQAPAT